MARSRRKTKSRSDSNGGYGALYRHVWNHPDYHNLSGNAVKLLMDLACQFNGHNNGDLTIAFSILSKRGWRSKGTIRRATRELLEAGMIVQTREGRFLNPGGVCDLYAVTWKPIDECPGKQLTLEPTNTPLRKFSLEDIRTHGPEIGQGSDHRLDRQRVRDRKGRYISVHMRDRLMVVT